MVVEDIHLERLQPGTTYKNFKKLADELGLKKAPGGNSKKALMDEIGRHFEYAQVGQEIRIISERPEPLPPPQRTGNNVKYGPLIKNLLYDSMVIQKYYWEYERNLDFSLDYYTTDRTKLQWEHDLGMVTLSYAEFIRGNLQDDLSIDYDKENIRPLINDF